MAGIILTFKKHTVRAYIALLGVDEPIRRRSVIYCGITAESIPSTPNLVAFHNGC